MPSASANSIHRRASLVPFWISCVPPMFAKIGIVGAILRNLKDVRADFFSNWFYRIPILRRLGRPQLPRKSCIHFVCLAHTSAHGRNQNGNDRAYLRIERGYQFQQNLTRVMPLAQSERFQGRWNYSSGTRGN